MAKEEDDGFVSLKFTDEERRENYGRPMGGGDEDDKIPDSAPWYNYGTRVRLCEDELKKMGLTFGKLPKVGSQVAIIAIGTLCEVSYRENGVDGNSTSCEIQLEEMVPLRELGGEEEEKSPRDVVREALGEMKGKK